MRGDRSDIQWKGSGCSTTLAHAANALVAGGMILSHVQHLRRAAFERAGVGFVANSVVEKYSVAGADGSLAVAERIPGEADARSGIKDMAGHAAVGNAVYAASLQAVEDSRVQIAEIQWNRRTGARSRTRRRIAIRRRAVEQNAGERIDGSLSSERFAVHRRHPVIDVVIFLVPISVQAYSQT